MVTGMVSGLLGAAAPVAAIVALMERFWLQVEPAATPPAFTPMGTMALVVPLVVSAPPGNSHAPPHEEETALTV